MSNKWQITTLDGAPTYHSEFGTVRFLKYEIVLVKQKKRQTEVCSQRHLVNVLAWQSVGRWSVIRRCCCIIGICWRMTVVPPSEMIWMHGGWCRMHRIQRGRVIHWGFVAAMGTKLTPNGPPVGRRSQLAVIVMGYHISCLGIG